MIWEAMLYSCFMFFFLRVDPDSKLVVETGWNALSVLCKCIPLRETTYLSSRPVMSGSVGDV